MRYAREVGVKKTLGSDRLGRGAKPPILGIKKSRKSTSKMTKKEVKKEGVFFRFGGKSAFFLVLERV